MMHLVQERPSRRILGTKEWREIFSGIPALDGRRAEELIGHDLELRRRDEVLDQLVNTLLHRNATDSQTLAHARRLARAYRLGRQP